MNLQNLIDYCQCMKEPDVLSGVVLPAPLDNEKCKDAIVMRCGLLTPVYGEPSVLRDMIDKWFASRTWNFDHLIKVVQAEYSPIENTDRYSEHEIITAGSDNRTKTGSDNRTIDRSVSDMRTRTPNLTDKTVDEISAENSNAYQADSQHTSTETGTDTTSGQHNELTKDNVGHEENESGSRDGSEKYTEHTHGNIGTTTNTMLINEELELLKRFNVYAWIAERIEEEFFIMVY